MPTNYTYLNAARHYATCGYAVFPCRERRQEPITANGFHDASDDERKLLHWWQRDPGANIGIACGKSSLAVFDIDSKHGADPREVIPELGIERLCLAVVWTGEAPEPCDKYPKSLSGMRGAHVWFHNPRGVRSFKLTLEGCEVKGDGGYVMAPPSVHPCGVPYLWHNRSHPPRVIDLPELPECLVPAPRADTKHPQLEEELLPGDTHNGLVRLAWDIASHGIYDEDFMLGGLLRVNEVRARRPEPAAEVARIAHWAVHSSVMAQKARKADAHRAQRNGKVSR